MPRSSSSGLRTRSSDTPAAPATSAMPSSVRTLTGSRKASLRRSSRTTPMTPERPRRRERARGSGPSYPSSAATARMRWRVSSETGPLPLKASDAVDGATPAARATAARVGREARGGLGRSAAGPALTPPVPDDPALPRPVPVDAALPRPGAGDAALPGPGPVAPGAGEAVLPAPGAGVAVLPAPGPVVPEPDAPGSLAVSSIAR
jgi:hypothetical protein